MLRFTDEYSEQDLCFWNMNAHGGNKVKIWQNLQVLHFVPAPGAFDVSEVWATLRWTYSPSLVTVSPPKLKLLHFLCKRDRIKDTQTAGQTDDPITRCLQRTFQVEGIKIQNWKVKHYQSSFEHSM